MRTIFLSLVSVIGGEAAVRAANSVAVLFIARTYGAVTLGAYAVSLALATVVVMFADIGLQTAAITQITSGSVNQNQIIGRLALSKTILLAGAAIILAVVAGWTRPRPLFLAIGIWVSVRVIMQSYSQLQMAILKAVSKADRIGIIQSLHACLLCVAVWLSFRRGWSAVALLEWLTACQLVELLLGTAVLFRSSAWPRWPVRLGFWATVRRAAAFGAFSAPNTILLIFYVSAWLFGSVLLPEMARLSSKPETLRVYANQWARLVVMVTVQCAFLVSLVAPKVS